MPTKPKSTKKNTHGKKKTLSSKPASPPKSGPRQLYLPKRVWYKPLTWRFKPAAPKYKPLPKARLLFAATCKQLWQHKKLFGGIVAIYGVLNIALVRGLSGSSDLETLKATLDSLTQGITGKLASSFASFGYLLATSGSANAQDSASYQYIVLTISSLAFIWALRQVSAKRSVRIRDSFYSGMYPIVPFFLVVLCIGLQLLPMLLSGTLYGLVVANHIAIGFWQKATFLVVFLVMTFWTLRMITSSIFASYIVTLPGMTPLRALRSAKQLVYGRRLLIWRKLIFLPIALLLLAALIEIPLILFATWLAPWIFFALSMVALPVGHAYLYNLYREML
jgi:hypothetical protein